MGEIMGYYAYCDRCGEGIKKPEFHDLRQGYVECWHCGEQWDHIDKIDSLFDLIEDLQEQINNLKGEK